MKKILAIIGSPRKGETYKTLRKFEEKLKANEEMEFEYIDLTGKEINSCKGCLTCIIKGEEYCRFKDDTQEIIQKMLAADGVIFATPVYSLQVSAQLKVFIDRIAYVFHRPCFFGKAFIAVTAQAIYGYKDVIGYLNKIAHVWGFNTVPGLGVDTPPGYSSLRQQTKNDKKLNQAVKEFYTALCGEKLRTPGWMDLMMFRMIRSVRPYIKVLPKDYEYFREKGWMESDYYYPVKLGLPKKLAGKFFDRLGRKNGEKMLREKLADNKIQVGSCA